MAQKIKSMIVLWMILVIFPSTTYAETLDFDYNEMFENHKLVKLIIDVETGKFITVNEAAVDYYGYTREELLKMKISEINTLSPEETRLEWESASMEKRNFFNFRHRLASGEIRDVEVHSYPFVYQGESYLYSIVIDKTEAVEVAKQLDRNRLIVNILMLLALFIALGWLITRAKAIKELKQSKIQLLSAYDETIKGWGYAIDLKDNETEEHSKRVTKLTLQLAKMLGVNEEDMVHIRRGAYLHDIGKMGIPDKILLKPGKLTDEEWEIMKKHPVYAYEMLSSINYLHPSLDIPCSHHEKWDGSGYPQGLKGEEIPLSARIFAVVDVYDALTSDRPYRKAWTKDKAMKYIEEQSGKHFDPQVVDVFLRLNYCD